MFGKVNSEPNGDSCITAGFVVGTPLTSIRQHGGTGTPLCRDAGFAKCNGAGGVIEQQREIIFTRENHTERIGAKAAVATVERRDHWNTDHANKVDRDKPAAAHCSAQ